jgi:FkbM family methyltransferase
MTPLLMKLRRYLKGSLSSIQRLAPKDFLRVMTGSDEVIKRIEEHRFSIVLNIHDRAIGLPILLKSGYEENVVQVFLNHLKPDTHFIDIGANIGYYSLLAASHCPQGKVFSFEPDATNFRRLKASISFNGFDAIVQAHQLAVSDHNGAILIYDAGSSANSGAKVTAKDTESLSPYVNAPNPIYKAIEAVTLDSFLGQTSIDLIKLDIEGHEPFALQGMQQLLRQNQPTIFTEFAPISLNHIGKSSPEDFLQFFIDLDYQISAIDETGNLVCCQQDIAAVIRYFQTQLQNHIDLLIKPRL